MKKIKFCIVGAARTRNTSDLKKEILRRRHEVVLICLSDLFSDGRLNSIGRKALDECDIFLFRGYNKNRSLATSLSREAMAKGKTVIDEILATEFDHGKTYQAKILRKSGIPHLPILFEPSLAEKISASDQMSFPVIAKPDDGRLGRGIKMLRTEKRLFDFWRTHHGTYLIQKYFPIKYDFRVFVVGEKVLGAIKRHMKKGEYRSNIPGGQREIFNLTEKMNDLSLRATQALNYEISGLDILEDAQGELFVIEVNIAPQWQVFKKVTGINPAIHIIDYALEKFSNKTPV